MKRFNKVNITYQIDLDYAVELVYLMTIFFYCLVIRDRQLALIVICTIKITGRAEDQSTDEEMITQTINITKDIKTQKKQEQRRPSIENGLMMF